jgi:Protein of unknown function (DUF1236)
MRNHLLCGAAFGLALCAGGTFAIAQDQTQENANRAVMAPQIGSGQAQPAPQAQVKGDLSIAKTPEDRLKAEQALEQAAQAALNKTNGVSDHNSPNGLSDNTNQPAKIDGAGTTRDEHQRAQQAVPPEPTTQAPTTPVFVNGKLAVSGMPPDAQTEPAKFSAKNDAVDKLNQNALTEKALSPQQRTTVYNELRASRETTGSANGSGTADEGHAQVGAVLPVTVELRLLPEGVVSEFRNIAIYRYARAGDKVLLVEPSNRAVVAVLGS